MHELSICETMLRQLGELCALHGAAGVRNVHLQVGLLAGVEPEALERAFCVARAGSCAATAALSIEIAPVILRCLRCDRQFTNPPKRLRCTGCGAGRMRVVSGDQLLLREVRLRMPEAPASRPERPPTRVH